MDTATIRKAAITAKLLGYSVHPGNYKTLYSGIRWTVQVLCPMRFQVLTLHQWGRELPLNSELLLGHWKVRLHMEKHYGIKTDHYWE